MALDTMTYTVSKGFRCSLKPRLRAVSFGDGYSQRVPDGLNSVVKEFDVSFQGRSIDDANAIIAFFSAKNGATAFLWTPPGESTALKMVCSEWNITYDSPISRSVTAKFRQVFDA